MKVIGYGFVYIGLMFVIIGVYGVFKFKSFYPRILASSKVDIVGELTIIIGLILINGLNSFSYKLMLILIILLIINPLNTHMLVRSAVNSGYKIRKD